MASTDVNSMGYPNTDSIIEDVYELKLASPAQPVNTTTIQETIEIKYEEIPPQVTNVQVQCTLGIEIVEQPAVNDHRFRYPSEKLPKKSGQPSSKAVGALQGAKSSPQNKSYPKVKVTGYKEGPAIVIASCVVEDIDVEDFGYKVHPNCIVGRNCTQGVCRIEVDPENDMTATFEKIGIECVTNKKIPESLDRCQRNKIDPFKQGFSHMEDKKYLKEMDMNSLRLCFQVFIPGAKLGDYIPGPTVVSDVVKDKRVHERLKIIDISDNFANVKGNKKIIMFTTKVNKDDIEVRFAFDHNGKSYELVGNVTDVHKQAGLSFTSPVFPDQQLTEDVQAKVYLLRKSDKVKSAPEDFVFRPNRPIKTAPKRTKQQTRAVTQNQDGNDDSTGKIEAPPRRQYPCDVGGSVTTNESFTDQINRGATNVITADDIMNLSLSPQIQVRN